MSRVLEYHFSGIRGTLETAKNIPLQIQTGQTENEVEKPTGNQMENLKQ